MTDSSQSGPPSGSSRGRWTAAPPLLAYGIEAPHVPALMLAGAVALAVAASVTGNIWYLVAGAVMLAQAVLFVYVTTRGKHRVWARLLDDLALIGDESVLDLGCGRGAVTIAVAQRLTRVSDVGLELWRSEDQNGNSPASALLATKR